MTSRSESAIHSFNLPVDQRADDQRGLLETTNLFESGQYDQLAELLRLSQAASERVGQSFLAEMFSAARNVCLACSRSRSEKDLHRQAEEEAGGREWELNQQLHAMLKTIAQTTMRAIPALGNPSDPALPEPDRPLAGNADSLSILCLGPFRVYRDKHMIGDWHSLKGLLILKYMVRHHKTPVAKDVLMDVFWPEADQEVARRNLHQAIYNLRQMLRRGQPDFRPILFENDCYLFNPEIALNLDFEAFERHVQTGRRMEAAGRSPEAFAEYRLAEELYRGDFMEQDPYEDWASLQREQIRNSYLEIADCLSEQQCRQGEYAAAIELCQKILAKDNCHEHAHRRLMRCYQCLGQRGSVIRQYRLCVEAMKRELDVPPSEETQSLLGKFVGAGKLNWLAQLIN